MPSADYMDIKKYQIQVGKQEQRSVDTKEAINQLNEHEHNVSDAIQSATNQ